MIKYFKAELRIAALIILFIFSFWLVDEAFDEMNKASTVGLLIGLAILVVVFVVWAWTCREVYLGIKNEVQIYMKEGTKKDAQKSDRLQ